MKSDLKSFKPGDLRPEIAIITGTRPGIIMMAPVLRELQQRSVPFFVIHSSQHYSPNMDAMIFQDLDLPQPEYRLDGVHAHKTHGGQTGVMLQGIEQILMDRRPAVMLVFGDTNSNLAAALAARKLNMTVVHVEGGERSGDWRKPEEQNRRLIDTISDVILATGEKAVANLKGEGVGDDRIVVTGNPIVDSSMQSVDRARRESTVLADLGVQPGGYAVMTMHREENVDDKAALSAALEGVSRAAQRLGIEKVLFLAHPRTQKRLEQFGLTDWVGSLPAIELTDAVPFLDFLALLTQARIAFTDSGGVSQETLIHRIPCVVLLEQTEWSEAVDVGAQILVGCDRDKIVEAAAVLDGRTDRDWGWPFGTPDSSRKIVDVLVGRLGTQTQDQPEGAMA